jgi:hypothetical protein
MARRKKGPDNGPDEDLEQWLKEQTAAIKSRDDTIRTYDKLKVEDRLAQARILYEVRKRIHEAKRPGGFDGWLLDDFHDATGWSRRHAYDVLRVYEVFGDCAESAQFDWYALVELSRHSTRGARETALALARRGVYISWSKANELIQAEKARMAAVPEREEAVTEYEAIEPQEQQAVTKPQQEAATESHDEPEEEAVEPEDGQPQAGNGRSAAGRPHREWEQLLRLKGLAVGCKWDYPPPDNEWGELMLLRAALRYAGRDVQARLDRLEQAGGRPKGISPMLED